jgi:hypothetical protein
MKTNDLTFVGAQFERSKLIPEEVILLTYFIMHKFLPVKYHNGIKPEFSYSCQMVQLLSGNVYESSEYLSHIDGPSPL